MARVSLITSNGINVERHAYCLCFPVVSATIFVAVINLAGSLICALLTFFFMVSNDHHSYFATRFVRDNETTNRINLISVLMYLLLAWVSAMLLYGVIKSKPRYILPFFGIQFIDYIFTLPQFFALFTNPYHYYAATAKTTKNLMDYHHYNNVNVLDTTTKSMTTSTTTTDFDDNMPNTTVWISTYQRNFQAYTTTLLVMTFFMIFKTYFLCVVWKCYRYLHMKEYLLPITALNALRNHHHNNGLDVPPALILNGRNVTTTTTVTNVPPPDYDEATKLPDYKPPEYTQVILNNNNGQNSENQSSSFANANNNVNSLDSSQQPTTTTNEQLSNNQQQQPESTKLMMMINDNINNV